MVRLENQRYTPPPKPLFWKIIHFPLVRMALALVVVGVAVIGAVTAASLAFGFTSRFDPAFYLLLETVLTLPAAHFSYVSYVKLIEQRPAFELSKLRAIRDLRRGALIGAGFFAALVAALYAMGYYRVAGINNPTVLIYPFVISVMAAYLEELFLRGILLRITEEALGTWPALLISSLVFGLLHIFNRNATLTGTLAIAIEAGILFGASYVLTRKLWMPIGIHFAWNFTQGGIFGLPVSGLDMQGLLDAELDGPAWLTGGAFGLENSIPAVILGLAVALVCLARAKRERQILAPVWKRTRMGL